MSTAPPADNTSRLSPELLAGALVLVVAIALVGLPSFYPFNAQTWAPHDPRAALESFPNYLPFSWVTCNFYPIFDPVTQRLFAQNPDVLALVAGAREAATHGVGRWWTGNWIQATSHFYRPLSSLAMWLEYRRWGTDFQKYCLVSWLLHALNCVLLFLLAVRLLRERGGRVALGVGVLAVVLFNLRRGITGPGWLAEGLGLQDLALPLRIPGAELAYWPAQTDLFSLACALGSLLLFDRYAQRGDWRRLAPALALYVVALLFKEMALIVALLAPLLIWYRRGRIPWGVLGAGAGLGLVLLLVRAWAVPEAQNPPLRGLVDLAWQVLFYLHWRLLTMALSGGYDWVFLAALGMLALLYAGRRFRLSIIYVIPGLLLWPLLMATLVGGNPAFAVTATNVTALGMALLFFGGVLVLVRSRERLVWVLAGMVLLVHLPVLHLQGPHYLYWPAAFWGLLDATLCWEAVRQWKAL